MYFKQSIKLTSQKIGKFRFVYISKAIAPAIFAAVQNPGLEYGPYHLFDFAQQAQDCLSPDHWEEIVKPVFINNSYFAHPENLLFGLLICPRSSQEDKQNAADLILEFRKVQRRSKAKKVRKLLFPRETKTNKNYPLWKVCGEQKTRKFCVL